MYIHKYNMIMNHIEKDLNNNITCPFTNVQLFVALERRLCVAETNVDICVV